MPRLALADIKKSLLRREGEVYLVPHLLRAGERAEALAALIDLYAGWVGRERSGFPEDAAAAIVGDYRMARCLSACLGEWYEWQSPAWPGPASALLAERLASRGITSASTLRLALWDAVNTQHGGYLASATREDALDAFASDLGMPRLILDLLLVLDSDAEAVLTCVADVAPTPHTLAARYNQRVVESVLANASVVEWSISPEDASERGLGTLVKRACFLARQLGVEYEVTTEESAAATTDTPPPVALGLVAERGVGYTTSAGGADLALHPRPLLLTLFGPQEVMGAPNAYGERLANLCRALLGYRRAADRGEAAFAGVHLRGTARVYLHGRPVRFTLDERLLKLLRDVRGDIDGGLSTPAPDDAFDSSLEAALFREFRALERAGEAHGWHIEREPEPLVRGPVILVPDFALDRDRRRIYLELAGYWRPGYRERKARKLAALRDRDDLALAAPESARAEFAALGGSIPTLWYEQRPSAQDLLALLDAHFNDFAARLAALDVDHVRVRVRAAGCLPPMEASALLHAYSRDEVARLVARIDGADAADAPRWIDGLGLCAPAWLASLLARLGARVAALPERRLPLKEVRQWLAGDVPAPEEVSEAVAETIARLAGLMVERGSLFAADVVCPDGDASEGVGEGVEANAAIRGDLARILTPSPAMPPATRSTQRAQPHARPRRKHNSVLYTTEPLFDADT